MSTAITSSQTIKLLALLEQRGVTPERFQLLLQNGIINDVFDSRVQIDGLDRLELREVLGIPLGAQNGDYRVTVDYGRKLTTAIEELGLTYSSSDYEGATPELLDLPKPQDGISKVIARLYDADDETRHDHKLLLSRISEQNCRPANIWESLAFCARYRHQATYVVVLGTKFKRESTKKFWSPCIYDPSPSHLLHHPGMKPKIDLQIVPNMGWSSTCRFLVIKQ